MTKFIFITGGVLSGLGKGIAAASIGHLLNGYKAVPIKCDGYLNVDPGTMNPIEHGEVFVLDDGGEVDMDFGHYERFINIPTKSNWNLTMGKVFQKIKEKERRGDYLGKTVQYVPHVTNLIQDWWQSIAKEEKADVLLIEVGGTVGDIESELYVEAARQLTGRLKREDYMFVHVTYVPTPYGVHEQKSKPTQQSVNILRSKGISPDMIIGRCKTILDDRVKAKIALFANIPTNAVISGVDTDNVYKIPIIFHQEGITRILEQRLSMRVRPKLERLKKLVDAMNNPSREITIALAGKYTALEDSYASVIEALHHAGANLNAKVNVKWLETSDEHDFHRAFADVDGVIVPGGFGTRGVEGKIKVIKYCREHNIPYLGLCYGLQLAVVEFARNVAGITDATSEEINPEADEQVICFLPEQKNVLQKGGTMRLGSYPAKLKPGTKVSQLYKQEVVHERHRHRFEVNPKYHALFERQGLIISGMSPSKQLVEFIELTDHPFFVATQAHPELKSTLFKPAPLFMGLVSASLRWQEPKQ